MFDIHQPLCDDDGEITAERVEEYINGLLEEFAASAEAKPVFEEYGDPGFAGMMLQYAIDYLGKTLPEMTLAHFNEVVFGLFPKKVSTEPESAPVIVAELRAFWSFLQRQYGLPNAGPILASLTNSATRRLERELANPDNYGMAKSMFMLGLQAGFDMTTQEGINAFMAAYNSSLPGSGADEDADLLLPPAGWVLPPSPLSPKERAEKRKKRKAQRQARKRNRK